MDTQSDFELSLTGLIYCHIMLFEKHKYGDRKKAMEHLANAIILKELHIERKNNPSAEDFCLMGNLRLKFELMKVNNG